MASQEQNASNDSKASSEDESGSQATTPSELTSEASSESISERSKLKLQLAVNLVSQAFQSEGPEANGIFSRYIHDPDSDNYYLNALDRADWMISKVQQQEHQPIYVYQFFSADETMKLSGKDSVEARLKDLGIAGFTRVSIGTLRDKVWGILDKLDKKSLQQEVISEQATDFIKHKVRQIGKSLHLKGGKSPSPSGIDSITIILQERLEELLTEHTKDIFTPKTWIMDQSKVEFFKEYCTLTRPEDKDLTDASDAPSNTTFLRPYAFFLCASIVAELTGDKSSILKLQVKPREELLDRVKTRKRNHQLGYKDLPFHPDLFPEFYSLWKDERGQP